MDENGNYVTRAELKAHLDPMRDDISEIKEDVKTLVNNDTGRRAVTHNLWSVLGLMATLCGGVVTAVLLTH